MGRNVITSYSRKEVFKIESGTPTTPFTDRDYDVYNTNSVFLQYSAASKDKTDIENITPVDVQAKLIAAQEIKLLELKVIIGVLSNEITARRVNAEIEAVNEKISVEKTVLIRNELISYRAFLLNAVVCAGLMSKIAREQRGKCAITIPSPATKCSKKVDFIIETDAGISIPILCRFSQNHTTSYTYNDIGASLVRAQADKDPALLKDKPLKLLADCRSEYDQEPVFVAVSYGEFSAMIKYSH